MNKEFLENASIEEISDFIDSLMEQVYEKEQIISTLSEQSKIVIEKLKEIQDQLFEARKNVEDLEEKNEVSEKKVQAIEETLDEFFKEKDLTTSDFYEFVTELKFKKGQQDGDQIK
jgi:uncharacterized coiled-coil protein SlyX